MSPLLRPAELAEAQSSSHPPVLLDVRWNLMGPPGADDYAAGHLPGAVFVDLDAVLAGPPGAGRHPLPPPDALEAGLRDAGVRGDCDIVVYDAGTMAAAARAWWVLRWAGLDAVRVLDGGLRAWTDAGLPTTTDVPDVRRGDVRVVPGSLPVLDAAGAARTAAAGILLDARTPERYRGEQEPVDPVAGRIPGAVNAPAGQDLEPGGLLAPEVLRERYRALGADGSRPVGAYCGSGVTAAQTVLALHVAGVPAELYVGSWSDWITDPSRPIETG